MITAQEAKDLAAPVRNKEIKDELECVEKYIIEAARKGQTSRLFSILLVEVINALVLQGFRVVTDHDKQTTIISWN